MGHGRSASVGEIKMKVITVAAAIILNDQHQLLVVRKQNTSCFMQVGGKLEPNESPAQTMRREIQEAVSYTHLPLPTILSV